MPLHAGAPSGAPLRYLRLEGAAFFFGGVAALSCLAPEQWKLWLALFLAPDLSMLAYLVNPRIGAAAYNFAHSYLAPVLLAALAMLQTPALLPYAILWIAHIGFDRALGYGLKYPDAFTSTHLGPIGRARAQMQKGE